MKPLFVLSALMSKLRNQVVLAAGAAIVFGAAAPGCAQVHESATPSVRFTEDFRGVPVEFPDGKRSIYPNPSVWAYTFWPGIKWPSSYGDGTNWLAANAEAQIYLTPFITTVNGKTIAPSLRYDPFSIEPDGLHVRASLLSTEQQRAYHAAGFRRFGSGMLLMRDSFRFGKVRMTAKLPQAEGAWPAFWMLAAHRTWPPEVDIFEIMAWRSHRQEMHVGVVALPHEDASKGAWLPVGTDVAGAFHEYGLDWSDEELIWTFDGRVVWRQTTPASLKTDMYLVINLAVGGKWVLNELGVLPIDGTDVQRLELGSKLIESSRYPAEMIIRSLTIETEAFRRPPIP